MHIRIANLEDEEKIVQCINNAYEKYIERIGKKPAPMLDDYQPKILDKCVHIVERGGRVMGIIILIPKANHLYLGNLAVHPSEQRKGIGKLLMNYAEKLAISLDLPEIRLFTNEAMFENISIYKKYDYLEVERKAENGYNRVYFVKYLDVDQVYAPDGGSALET